MTNKAHQPLVNSINHIIFYQIVLVLPFLLLVFLLKKSLLSTASASAGAIAYCLPTAIFARGIAACAGARSISYFMLAFMGGELVKLLLSGALFICAIHFFHLSWGDAVVGLVAAIIAFWISSIASVSFYKKNTDKLIGTET